ncbi:uncharacterized protein LOC127251655 isoform X2 [Andrographis paniculata]|uniref:uncharacterized protein LOC127251655 isoform X2 n=1 Tax=Andrographis paniculata TaxID=175694 RepID=UPI0021E7C95C|nr:uncharacterized protein LOC127251655 isoform X2 [Andrographis paniculata]
MHTVNFKSRILTTEQAIPMFIEEMKLGRTPSPLDVYQRCWANKDGSFPNKKLRGVADKLLEFQSEAPTQEAICTPLASNESLVKKLGGFNKRGLIAGFGSESRAARAQMRVSTSLYATPDVYSQHLIAEQQEKLEAYEAKIEQMQRRMDEMEACLNQQSNSGTDSGDPTVGDERPGRTSNSSLDSR